MSSHHTSLFGTVLVVDDDESTRAAFTAILTSLGHLVFAAHDGAVALESLRVALPDVVITDVEMPSLNGIELCRAIRKEPPFQHLPVVAVSSAELDGRPEAGLFDVCLRKPISPQQLVVAVSIFLRPEPRGNHDSSSTPAADEADSR